MNGLVTIGLSVIGLDDEETGTEILLLREELENLQVESVQRPTSRSGPSGTRAGELIEAGAVLVGLTASPEVVSATLNPLGGWLGRRRRGDLEVRIGADTLVLHRATADQQQAIVDAFVKRALDR
jgi:hypothetical protein